MAKKKTPAHDWKPWSKASDVPIGAAFRCRAWEDEDDDSGVDQHYPVLVTDGGITFLVAAEQPAKSKMGIAVAAFFRTYPDLAEDWEHRVPGGVEWKRCGEYVFRGG